MKNTKNTKNRVIAIITTAVVTASIATTVCFTCMFHLLGAKKSKHINT